MSWKAWCIEDTWVRWELRKVLEGVPQAGQGDTAEVQPSTWISKNKQTLEVVCQSYLCEFSDNFIKSRLAHQRAGSAEQAASSKVCATPRVVKPLLQAYARCSFIVCLFQMSLLVPSRARVRVGM